MTNNTVSNVVVSDVISAIADSVESGMTPAVAISNSDYGIADRAEKARIRGAFKARFDSAMRDGKFDVAQINWGISDAFRSVSNSAKPTVTNSDELRSAIHGMVRALSGMISGEFAPTGIDPVDLSAEFNFGMTGDGEFGFEFTGEYDGDVPEFDSEFVARFIPRRISRNAPTNDVGELIAEFMATVDVNSEMKISEIRNGIHAMHPELGVNSGWDGRISARLFPNESDTNPNGECTISDIVGTVRASDGRKCGMRIA